jgi:methylmalonyl-CoA/ethylmalonyl-CoA epimerase
VVLIRRPWLESESGRKRCWEWRTGLRSAGCRGRRVCRSRRSPVRWGWRGTRCGRRSARIYRDLLGGTFLGGGDNPRVGQRYIQLRYADGTKIELIEPLAGSDLFDSFFRRTGGGGLHHVTFKVDDLPGAIERLRALGFTPIGAHLDHEYWQEVFLQPKEAYGTLVQIAHTPKPWPEMPGLTLEDVLAGRGFAGTGIASP